MRCIFLVLSLALSQQQQPKLTTVIWILFLVSACVWLGNLMDGWLDYGSAGRRSR
jgi:hypothetical protein